MLDTSVVVLATAVVFGERVLFPMFKIVAAMLESFVNSLEVPQESMPQLEIPSKEYELVEAVQPENAYGRMIIQDIEAG
ncbi:putative conserved membrane protein [Synechococcus sp. A18-46.1]|nr:putative conserved membrane protein [Synechococcus sp. A18-46.1]